MNACELYVARLPLPNTGFSLVLNDRYANAPLLCTTFPFQAPLFYACTTALPALWVEMKAHFLYNAVSTVRVQMHLEDHSAVVRIGGTVPAAPSYFDRICKMHCSAVTCTSSRPGALGGWTGLLAVICSNALIKYLPAYRAP